MTPDALPQYVVLDLRKDLHELRCFILEDERGYEEMVRQAFDYVSDVTQDNDLLHHERAPHLNYGMVIGLHHRTSIETRDEALLVFATLYDGIRRELMRLGVDQLVAQGGQFPFVLHQIRTDGSVVLRRLKLTETIR